MLVEKLPDGPLDIVGDVHGELDALKQLLKVMGYSDAGEHPEGRKLVFVGDLTDRGPDSPGFEKNNRHVNHVTALFLKS